MAEIILTQGKKAIIDDEDYVRVNRHNWCAVKKKRNFYAATQLQDKRGIYTFTYMHNFIVNSRKRIDHKNNNGLSKREFKKSISKTKLCKSKTPDK